MRKIQLALERNRNEKIDRKRGHVVRVADGGSAPQQSGLGLSEIRLDRERLRDNRVFLGIERESVAMAYKVLRTKVYQELNKHGWGTVGVTSSNQAEGKSLTALNLAMGLAGSVYQTVILLDFDMRRPSLAKKLDFSPKYGLSDYYINDVPLEKIAIRIAGSDLILIPGKNSLDDASEWIASHKTEQLFEELAEMFPSHFKVVDLPPVLAVDDVMAFGSNMDCCLVVASEGMTRKEELEETLRILEFNNVLGVILNKSGEAQMGRYYYYSRYYKSYYAK